MVKPLNTFEDNLTALILSGTQVMFVKTDEERRVLDAIYDVAMNRLSSPGDAAWRVVEYDIVAGFSGPSAARGRMAEDPVHAIQAVVSDSFDAANAANAKIVRSPCTGIVERVCPAPSGGIMVTIDEYSVSLYDDTSPIVRRGQRVSADAPLAAPDTGDTLFVFKDMANYFNGDAVGCRRALLNLFSVQALNTRTFRRPIIFIGAVPLRHPEIDYAVVNVPFERPTEEQLAGEVDYVCESLPAHARGITPPFRNKLARGLLGLSQVEASNVLAKVAWAFGGFQHGDKQEDVEAAMLHEIYEATAEIWAKDEALKLYDLTKVSGFDLMGGYDVLQDWWRKRLVCFDPEARELGIPYPRGIVLGGVPGTGKSTVALTMAKAAGLPLIDFNLGRVFNALVGASEERMDAAIDRINSKGPCVVRLDEADKMLSGIVGSGQVGENDGGIGIRVGGRMLSWLTDERRKAFIILTLNRTEGLPPEMLRRGRWT